MTDAVMTPTDAAARLVLEVPPSSPLASEVPPSPSPPRLSAEQIVACVGAHLKQLVFACPRHQNVARPFLEASCHLVLSMEKAQLRSAAHCCTSNGQSFVSATEG